MELTSINSNSVIETQLADRLRKLSDAAGSEVIGYMGPIWGGVDDIIRRTVEKIAAQGEKKNKKLMFLLETTGGRIDVVERIARTLRQHYKIVEFIVPNVAFSAGTVLVMSGDAIYMDYYSVLGPIDPQVEKTSERKLLPAVGYLAEFDRLIEKSKTKSGLSTAELAYLIDRFDPAELYQYKQARQLSISLLEEWLVQYKFKNWKKTKTRGLKVTKQMKVERARQIAKQLDDPELWHSHGRGIHMDVLRRRLNLVIEDFEENADLNNAVRDYYGLFTDYMRKLGHNLAVHSSLRYFGLRIDFRG